MYNQNFFTNVLRFLADNKMSKHQLAERAGMSVSFLSELTNGKANPSLKMMESIATVLGTPLPALLEMTDLDRETLEALSDGKQPSGLPPGFMRTTAILNEYQAFMVQQWDDANRLRISGKKPKKS